MWNTTQLYTNGVLAVDGAGLAGDYNLNGTVDAADYVIWRKTLGQTGSGLAADGNGDEIIDTEDYDVWRVNFDRTAGGAAATSAIVPESETLLTLIIGIMAIVFCRRGLVLSTSASEPRLFARAAKLATMNEIDRFLDCVPVAQLDRVSASEAEG